MFDMSLNPYRGFPNTSFWKRSVSEKSFFDISHLWHPKFEMSSHDTFTTYGSCFAQHFSKALRNVGIKWRNSESAPFFISEELKTKYNYDVYSSRTQNIYTPTMLLQWLTMSINKNFTAYEFFEDNGRFYDPLRPTVEPNGFVSQSELLRAREVTAACFVKSIIDCSVFVFTLGLTERWINKETQMEYAQCPGVTIGKFDKTLHIPQNLYFPDLRRAMTTSLAIIQKLNPKIKVLLTVSPVPLVATFQQKHVLVATTEAKSALRAVASFCQQQMDFVDYFPSYEVISSFPYKASFYEPDLRSVNSAGVNHVIKTFFESTGISTQTSSQQVVVDNDTVCEEVLLDAFGDS